MKSATYPLAMPNDLLDEIRHTAKATGLSMADAMRQSVKPGLPKLREQLSTAHLKPACGELNSEAREPDRCRRAAR